MAAVMTREATPADAAQMSVILRDILTEWKSDRPHSVEHVLAFYVQHPERLRCTVAVDTNGDVIGFQSLKRASQGNVYGVPMGWGVIGTYVKAAATGRGVGKALFASSLDAARKAGLTDIDASIGQSNAAALAYYEAMGFRTHRTKPGAVSKKYSLA